MTEHTIVGIGCLIFALIGILYCPRWIKDAVSGKDKATGVFCLIMSIFILLIAIFLLGNH